MSKIAWKTKEPPKGKRFKIVKNEDGTSSAVEIPRGEYKGKEKKSNILIKSPFRIKIKEDDAYHKRREKLLNTPGFKPPDNKGKSKEEIFAEADGRISALLTKISNKANFERLVKGDMPGEITAFAKKARSAIRVADDNLVNYTDQRERI